MSKKQPKVPESYYIPLNISDVINSYGTITSAGETCHIDAIKDRWVWAKGTLSGVYGWSNDGKGTFVDYLTLVKYAFSPEWKFLKCKTEDMNTIMVDGKPKLSANVIYENLAWMLTGKTWHKGFYEREKKNGALMMTEDENSEALAKITKNFFVIHPPRKWSELIGYLKFMILNYKIDVWEIDPWSYVDLSEIKGNTYIQHVSAFIELKELAMETNTCGIIVNNPYSRDGQDRVNPKDGRSKFKVVTPGMQIGGSAWDMKMDIQLSYERPEKHISMTDPKVNLWNFKAKQSEILGLYKGVTEGIEFDRNKRQYYFDDINPLTGENRKLKNQKGIFDDDPIVPPPMPTSKDGQEMPF